MKKHDTRWRNVWGEVRKVDVEGELYYDFVLSVGNYYDRQLVSADLVDSNPAVYEFIFEMLIDRLSTAVHKGGWFG